jgi:predicted KAP-like P-loop ATPase
MQNYVLRVYNTHAKYADSISGVIEDIDSGHRESFHNLIELQSILVHSSENSQAGFPAIVSQELDTHDNVAVIG